MRRFFAFFTRRQHIRIIISILVLVNAYIIVMPLSGAYSTYVIWKVNGFTSWLNSLGFTELLDIPRFFIGGALVFLSFFLLLSSRVAWVFTIILLLLNATVNIFLTNSNFLAGITSLVMSLLLIASFKFYSHISLISSTFVAFASFIFLLAYSSFGSLYLGDFFAPKIEDILTAFYFSIITMTTVGYGDIVPVNPTARTFTISIVIFGVIIFATSIVYIVRVFVKGTKKIVRKRVSLMKDHFVIIGSTDLAVNLYHGITKRDLPVVVLCADQDVFIKKKDDTFNPTIIEGDPALDSSLQAANVGDAKVILIVTADDSSNTFTLLGVQNLKHKRAKTVILVNKEQNIQKISRLKPDMLFSFSSLSSEILLKILCGEKIDRESVAHMLLDRILEENKVQQEKEEEKK